MARTLDRSAHLRGDADRLMNALDAGGTRLVPVWRGQCLLESEGEHPRAALLPVGAHGPLIDRADELVWLGQLEGSDCFGLDLSSIEEGELKSLVPNSAGSFGDLRFQTVLDREEYALLAFAKGLLHWHRQNRFCGRCGAETRAREGGHTRECTREGDKTFPRTDPAIMLAIEHDNQLLIARQPGFPPGMYSILAGFVEPGETLEEAAIREAQEEVGLRVTISRYFRSQAWPFPQSLMLAFIAESGSADFSLDDDELEHARWVSREQLRNPTDFVYPPPSSLAYHVIQDFLARG